jgi:hypothetical protein
VSTLFFIISCAPKIYVSRIADIKDKRVNSGIFYALPKATIRVDIVVNENKYVKGPYAEFAGKYLGLTNVIESNYTSFTINEVKLNSIEEPDASQYFYIKPSKFGWSKKQPFSLQLAESGILLSSNPEQQKAENINSDDGYAQDAEVYPDILKYFTDLNLFEKVDTIIEKVKSDSLTIEKMTFKRSIVAKTPEQKAKDAADFIIKIKENRFNLISGYQEVNYDKETIKHMDEELEKLENEYMKLFTGISFSKKKSYSFYYTPDPAKSIDTIALCYFSSLKGINTSANETTEPIVLTINKTGITDSLNSVVMQNAKETKKGKQGFYYRLSDIANITVSFDADKNISLKLAIPQYGIVCSMPLNVKNIDFNKLGGIISVKNP